MGALETHSQQLSCGVLRIVRSSEEVLFPTFAVLRCAMGEGKSNAMITHSVIVLVQQFCGVTEKRK